MLSEEDRRLFPIILNFETEHFEVQFQLSMNQNNEEVFMIELRHKEHVNQVHVCQIDKEKLKSLGYIHLFERPSNLFFEMTVVLEDIKISQYGEIEFYMSLGQQSKYPVTLYATRKGVDSEDYLKKQQLFLKSLETHCMLQQKYAQNALKIMSKVALRNREVRKIPDNIKLLSRSAWQRNLQKGYGKWLQQMRVGLVKSIFQGSDS